MKGEGLIAKRDIPADTVIAQYSGYRLNDRDGRLPPNREMKGYYLQLLVTLNTKDNDCFFA